MVALDLAQERVLPTGYEAVPVGEGYLYRKLGELGYTDIAGLARFDLTLHGAQPPYDLVLMACEKNLKELYLLITLDKRFQSILDIYAYEPGQTVLRMIKCPPDDVSTLHLDFILFEIDSPMTSGASIMVSPGGKMVQLF